MRRYIAPRIVRSAENQPQAHLPLPSALIALLITHASWFITHLLCAVPGFRAPNIRLDKALRVLGLHLHATRPLHSLTHSHPRPHYHHHYSSTTCTILDRDRALPNDCGVHSCNSDSTVPPYGDALTLPPDSSLIPPALLCLA